MTTINWSYLITATDNDPRRLAAIDPNETVSGSHTHTANTPNVSIVPNLGLGPNYQSESLAYNTTENSAFIEFDFNTNGSISITGFAEPATGDSWMEGTAPYADSVPSVAASLTRFYLTPTVANASADIEIKFDISGPTGAGYSVNTNANGVYTANSAYFRLNTNGPTIRTGTWTVTASVRNISNPANIISHTMSIKVSSIADPNEEP